MIETVVYLNGVEIARIEITNDLTGTPELGEYSVKFGVERGTAVGVHTRNISRFPRKQFNVLALLRQALMTLEEKELKLEDDYDPDEPTEAGPSDLARRLGRAVSEVQGWAGGLHHHRPALRSGQSEQDAYNRSRQEVRPQDRE